MIFDEDEHDALRERLYLARRALREAYEQRDTLARKIAAIENDRDTVVPPWAVAAMTTVDGAVLAAEVDMKDAEYALGEAVMHRRADRT